MTTYSLAGQIQTIRGISLTAVGITLMMLGAGVGVGYIIFGSGVLRMIAAAVASYIGIFA
jgi:hypothetical protein